jgi:hypothetical protein
VLSCDMYVLECVCVCMCICVCVCVYIYIYIYIYIYMYIHNYKYTYLFKVAVLNCFAPNIHACTHVQSCCADDVEEV